MSNELEDLLTEVEKLKKGGPEQPVASTHPTSAEAPEDAGPPVPREPQLLGVNLEHSIVVSTIGEFPLSDDESREVIRICLKALTRSLYNTFGQVAKHHGLEVPKKTGLKTAADNVS